MKNKLVKKEKLTKVDRRKLLSLADDFEAQTLDVFDAGLINADPGMCPNCGGDLDVGDHNFCSRF